MKGDRIEGVESQKRVRKTQMNCAKVEGKTNSREHEELEWIDAHSHLLWPSIYSQVEEIVENAQKKGVTTIINIGIQTAEIPKCLQLQEQFPHVYQGIGLHPEESVAPQGDVEQFIREFRKVHTKFVALGEIGLDFWQVKDSSLRLLQEQSFRRQLDLACEIQKPVVIHCRNAEKQAIQILEESQYDQIPRVLLHCFGGVQKHLEQALTHENWYFTIPTSVVYKKIHRILAMKVPLGKILLETDAPFLKPFKELEINEPQYVIEVGKEVAKLKEIDITEVAKITSATTRFFYDLPQ